MKRKLKTSRKQSSLMARQKNPTYYFIDIDIESRQVIGWGEEGKDTVEVQLTDGYHRVFLSRGQYNKLVRQLES